MYNQQHAKNFIEKGAAYNWPPHNKPPKHSIGFTLEEGSWAVLGETESNTKRRLFRSPQQTGYGGTVWDESSRFSTINQWQYKPVWGSYWFPWLRDLDQRRANLEVDRKPLEIPWNNKWITPGGTGASKDNGTIILLSDGTWYEIQGMRKVNASDILLINARTLSFTCGSNDWVCDGINHMTPKTTPIGSQGPKAKLDGLLTPDYLDRYIPDVEIRVVGFNVEFGPGARAVRPGWVERPQVGYNGNPFGPSSGVIMPEGASDEYLIPNYLGMAHDISDGSILMWLQHLHNKHGLMSDEYRNARINFASNIRGWAWGSPRPETLKTRLRVSETGGWEPIIESVGGLNPKHKEEFKAHGVVTGSDAFHIGEDIFLFGTLVVTDGIELTDR